MEKIDTRTLKPEVQTQFRYQAVRLRKADKTYQEIIALLGVSYTSACQWCKTYEREGIKGIRAKKRERKVGSCCTLNADQEKEMKRMIQDECPEQLKLPYPDFRQDYTCHSKQLLCPHPCACHHPLITP